MGYGLVRMESHILIVGKHPYMLSVASGIGWGEYFPLGLRSCRKAGFLGWVCLLRPV